MLRDIVQLDDERPAAQPLLQLCMRAGRRVTPAPSLDEIRGHHATQMRTLPVALRSLEPTPRSYAVEISTAVRALAREVDAAMGQGRFNAAVAALSMNSAPLARIRSSARSDAMIRAPGAAGSRARKSPIALNQFQVMYAYVHLAFMLLVVVLLAMGEEPRAKAIGLTPTSSSRPARATASRARF